MHGFIDFIKKQGVAGLAVGFILGGAVSKVVTALITDVVNPLLGIALGAAKGLESATVALGPVEILLGHFVSVMIDFLVIALVVYFGVKALGLDKLGKTA
ncbi:MAG: MscL family protein [Gammaproteobacteria bacterium]|nr:MscL family protein [Gammaproteobacteria bacterium]